MLTVYFYLIFSFLITTTIYSDERKQSSSRNFLTSELTEWRNFFTFEPATQPKEDLESLLIKKYPLVIGAISATLGCAIAAWYCNPQEAYIYKKGLGAVCGGLVGVLWPLSNQIEIRRALKDREQQNSQLN